MKVFFILGSGHSGSTLLDLLLNGHSAVFGAGEVATIHTGGRSAKSNPMWQQILIGLSEDDIEPSRSKWDLLRGAPNFVQVLDGKSIDREKYIAFHEELYTRMQRVTGKAVISDTSKEANRLEILTQSKTLEPVIVHLVRDGRAVTWSYLRKLSRHRFFALSKWAFENLKIEIIRRRLANVPYVCIRYEDLVHHPEGTLRQVLKEAGLSYEPGMLEFRSTSYHGVGGNRMKLASGSEIKEDVSWRKEMPYMYRVVYNLLFGLLNWYYQRRK